MRLWCREFLRRGDGARFPVLTRTFWIAKPLRTEGFESRSLFVAILRGRIRLKGVQEVCGDAGDFINRGEERFFVRLGRLIEAADLSNEPAAMQLEFHLALRVDRS